MTLPIRRMVLYKHGVGFFERIGRVMDTTQVELTFKKEEMNDVLKSLAVFPQGEAQVINVSYETPEDKASALAKAPIRLSPDQALIDLLKSLRGRQVRLHLQESEAQESQVQAAVRTTGGEFAIAGTLLGVDTATLANTLVSLLISGTEADGNPALRTYKLRQVQGVDILEAQSGDDLRYVLDLSRANPDKRSVTILLNAPNQEVLVSYVAPTPTWRVSYRLVYTPDPTPPGGAPAETGKLLLQGWGIVDNQLDEDLDGVELTLIAGQPISFVYDLYTPRLIERPQVQDEERTVAGPVMFDAPLPMAAPLAPEAIAGIIADEFYETAPQPHQKSARSAPKAAMRRDMAAATSIQAKGVAKGELFQYEVGAPVTIKRGQSAMVPILGATLDGRKEHLYNGEKVPGHPVVTLTAHNTSGLTLERGPVTVLEADNYVGEAVIAFTPTEGELYIPYAVDLGVKVTEQPHFREETAGIRLGQGYLIHDWYHIATVEYTLENRNPEPIHLVIEQRIQPEYQLFETPEPAAQTVEFYRWRLTIDPRTSRQFVTQARNLVSRQEQIRDLSYQALQHYLADKFIDQALFSQLKAILDLYRQVAQNQHIIERQTKHRDRLLKEQQQTAEKLKNLGQDGAEGELRQRFVSKMQDLEDECDRLSQDITSLESRTLQLHDQIATQLRSLS